MELVIDFQDVDKIIFQQLSEEAEQRNMSVNSLALHLVCQGLATLQQKSEGTIYHDLDNLAGTWPAEETEAFEAVMADFGQIDKQLWS